MSNLEPPPPPPPLSSSHFPPEKPPGNAIPGPSINTTNYIPSSTEHKPEDRRAEIMENFKGMIFKFAMSSSPTKSLSPMQRSLVEKRLDEVFPSFRTPDHPTYTAMIEAAIKKLGEEGAASEEGISQFIRKEYPDLPWAHDTILKHHLGNLCENGSVVKTSDGHYMLYNVVSNQDSASASGPSPCSSIDAYSSFSLSPGRSPSSSSWSDTSYCSSPRPKRKRQMYIRRRKKRGRRKGTKNERSNKGKVNRTRGIRVARRRRGRPLKQDVLEDETETSDEHLMLEEKSEELEADNESEEECTEGMEGINQVRGKRRRIRKQDQRQENGLMIETQLDNHEDMIDEGQRDLQTRGMKGRKAHLKSTSVLGRRRGRPRKEFSSVEKTQPCVEEMETDIQYPVKIEVPKEEYRINKELVDVVEDHNQVQVSMHGTLESSHAEDTLTVIKIGKLESVGEVNKPIKPCDFVMQVVPKNGEGVEECDEQKEHDNFEGIEEQSQLEEYKKVPGEDHSNGQKRRGRPPKTSVKGRKVQPKTKRIPGEEYKKVPGEDHSNGQKRRGRPPKTSVKGRKFQPKTKRIPGRPRGRPRKKDLSVEKTQPNEEQMDTTDIQDSILEEKTEVPVQRNDTNKEVTEVVEEDNQSQEYLCETLDRSPAEVIEMVQEIEKYGPEEKKRIEQFNLVMEGDPENDEATKGCVGQKEHEKFPHSEDKTQFEEPNMVPKQGQKNRRKRRRKLLNKGTKDREVHMKHSHVPGRGRGRPRKKDILVEKTQANAEQRETTDSHEAMFKENTEVPNENCGINKECTEVVEECSELKGNMHETSELSPVEKTEIMKEVRKPGLVAEENLLLKRDCRMMEGERQQNWDIKELNEQKENENAFDEEPNQSAKEKNEMTFGENQPKRQENEEQNQQLEKYLKSITEKEIELPEMIGQDAPIQENIQSGGQYGSIAKTLLSVDVAQRSMDSKAIVLPEESFNSVLQESKEISNKSIEQQRELPTEEKVLEIDGRQREVIEQKPESSTAGYSQLTLIERSSQQQYLPQQQLEEEKPLDGKLHSHSPNSYNLCRML